MKKKKTSPEAEAPMLYQEAWDRAVASAEYHDAVGELIADLETRQVPDGVLGWLGPHIDQLVAIHAKVWNPNDA